VVESKKQLDSSFERHSMIVFEEDMEVFLDGLNQAVAFLKSDRKPKRTLPRSTGTTTEN
jgi:hypothetical protein